MCREFAKEKDRVESRAVFLRIKEEQKLEREMNGYMNWICRAGGSHTKNGRACVAYKSPFPPNHENPVGKPLHVILFFFNSLAMHGRSY